MSTFNLILDSEKSVEGNRTRARFQIYKRMNVKKISLKFFGTNNNFTSSRAQDYILIDVTNPFNEDLIQSRTSSNKDGAFVIPYSTVATEIIYSEADFEQTIAGSGGELSDIWVQISHNDNSTFTLDPWIMVLQITTD